MNFDRDSRNTDEYFVTAVQIFDCCGVESSGSLRVDALMDKFAPFVKPNKAEFSLLSSLLDPEQTNPDIDVTKLATALHQYSENQKTKVDLDESFNLRSGQMPQDSDSGISTDGLQLLDDLQSELREKEHLAQQLRAQLDYCDRQHEDALAAIVAERDVLRSHLNMVREENASLVHVRRDYDDVCERLGAAEAAQADAGRQLDAQRRRNKALEDEVAQLENDKATYQELLSKSKDECHRINEMYSARQTALREENETLRAARADLAARLADHDHYMQQIIQEKVQLEMELKDVLNKSNQTQQRLDRSIDVSYTEDQMLTALDTLNADSKFITDQTSVSTQVAVPCGECERNKVLAHRGLKRFFWDPLKSLFQIFAVICFMCAVCVLCGVAARGAHAPCRAAPWRWLQLHDLMDLLFRIEYTADVPM